METLAFASTALAKGAFTSKGPLRGRPALDEERRVLCVRSAVMDASAFHPVYITWLDVTLRVAAALVLSLALGLERFWRRKPVDFRPFVIIALASCALSLSIVEFAYRADDDSLSVDPAKVLSGVMSGIGFIGAGALFREEHAVQGAGSAAAIWASGAIGLVCGLGFIWLAGIVSLAVLTVLIVSRPFTEDYTVRIDDKE